MASALLKWPYGGELTINIEPSLEDENWNTLCYPVLFFQVLFPQLNTYISCKSL